MQFALVLILCIAGLLTLQWSFLFGCVIFSAGVILHTIIDKRSEHSFFAFMFVIAAIGTIVSVAADIWQRLTH